MKDKLRPCIRGGGMRTKPVHRGEGDRDDKTQRFVRLERRSPIKKALSPDPPVPANVASGRRVGPEWRDPRISRSQTRVVLRPRLLDDAPNKAQPPGCVHRGKGCKQRRHRRRVAGELDGAPPENDRQ